jgi:hypothetical protein
VCRLLGCAGRPHTGHISLRDDRHSAHDTRFDNDIAWTADHQQMLDIVTPDQHEAPAVINRSSVGNAKPPPRVIALRRRVPNKRRISQNPAIITMRTTVKMMKKRGSNRVSIICRFLGG